VDEEKANVGAATKNAVLVGPAGWSYTDWAGIVYPHHKPRGFHEAAYLAQFFDTIEINTSFYSPPRAEIVKAWAEKVAFNPRFKFSAKLWKRFTHERNANLQDERAFKHGLEPLVNEGRLGALLVQLPWSFKNTPENHEYLSGLIMQFMEYPLVLEVRHDSWNKPEVFEWLAGLGVGFCNIDQPTQPRRWDTSACTAATTSTGSLPTSTPKNATIICTARLSSSLGRRAFGVSPGMPS
jgi:uncharacterized protein YecE (DUF72 family)